MELSGDYASLKKLHNDIEQLIQAYDDNKATSDDLYHDVSKFRLVLSKYAFNPNLLKNEHKEFADCNKLFKELLIRLDKNIQEHPSGWDLPPDQ